MLVSSNLDNTLRYSQMELGTRKKNTSSPLLDRILLCAQNIIKYI